MQFSINIFHNIIFVMKSILHDMGLVPDNDSKNTLKKLYLKPDKTPNAELPHIKVPEKGMTYQADLLYLPDDQGFHYLLVVIDNNNNALDFEPMKNRTASTTLESIKKIFARKYLNKPRFMIEVDNGVEFGGLFKSFFENCKVKKDRIYVKKNHAGRHSQLGLVENLNKIIGAVIHMQLTDDEVNTGEESRNWLDLLPKLRVSMNKHLRRNKSKVIDNETLTKCEGELLPIGSKVRVLLDNPKSVSGKKLHGNFRASDIRWEVEPRTIEEYILRIDQPPMYIVSGITNCVYRRQQLQVVSDDETKGVQRKFIIDKLLRRFTEKRVVKYEVLWSGGEKTIEPRAHLMKDVPQLVLEFEAKKVKQD